MRLNCLDRIFLAWPEPSPTSVRRPRPRPPGGHHPQADDHPQATHRDFREPRWPSESHGRPFNPTPTIFKKSVLAWLLCPFFPGNGGGCLKECLPPLHLPHQLGDALLCANDSLPEFGAPGSRFPSVSVNLAPLFFRTAHPLDPLSVIGAHLPPSPLEVPPRVCSPEPRPTTRQEGARVHRESRTT